MRTYDPNLKHQLERKAVKTEQGTNQTNTPPPTTTISGKALSLDVDLMAFAHHLDASGLSDEQKQEYLGIFWNLAMAFVDLGYGINATQMACGHLTKSFEKEGVYPPDSLDSNQAITKEGGARP